MPPVQVAKEMKQETTRVKLLISPISKIMLLTAIQAPSFAGRNATGDLFNVILQTILLTVKKNNLQTLKSAQTYVNQNELGLSKLKS